MSWSLSASGHCDDEDLEATLVSKLREVLAEDDESGTSTAVMYTEHQGVVDLLPPVVVDEPYGGL
jgi:hypothetical protein